MEVGPFVGEETAEQFKKYLEETDALYGGECRLLEVGTGMGDSAALIAEMFPDWVIYTIDSFGLAGDGRIYEKWDSEKVGKVFSRLRGGKIVQILADSKDVYWDIPVEALYIDGGHYYDTVKSDFNKFSPFLMPGGYCFMHDYHREDFGVKQVVEEAVESGLYELVFANKVAVLLKK